LSVWDSQHPKPSGDQVGQPHEIAVVNWFKRQAAGQIEPLLQPQSKADAGKAREVLGGALEVMIGRKLPAKGESHFSRRTQEDRGSFFLERGLTAYGGDAIETMLLYPKKGSRKVVLWLTFKGEESIIRADGKPSESAAELLNRGFAIACPKLYLLEATRNPNVYAPDKRKSGGAYENFAGYHYGYNPTLFAERVRDALAVIAQLRDDPKHPARQIFVAGVEGAGVVAAAATALAPSAVQRLACDTEGFRFAKLQDVWDVNFVPGAEKYGDVPAILSLCAPVSTTLLGETKGSVPGVAAAFAVAKGKLELAGAARPTPAEAVAAALTRGK
jgi:hypothetical protein